MLTPPPIFEVDSDPITALPKPKAWVQPGPPLSTTGYRRGQQHFDLATGNLYELKLVGGALTWTLIVNLKGPKGDDGDTDLSTEDRAALVEQILDETESDIDLVLLFENGLAG